jgi:hypothetical protein
MNLNSHGVCENRADDQIKDESKVKVYFYVKVLDVEVMDRKYVIGGPDPKRGDPGAQLGLKLPFGGRRRRSRRHTAGDGGVDVFDDSEFQRRYLQGSKNESNRQRRGGWKTELTTFGKDFLQDMLSDYVTAPMCFGNNNIPLFPEKYLSFFEFTVQPCIPLFLGVCLDLGMKAGLYVNMVANAQICPLSLTLEGGIGPRARVVLSLNAALKVVLFRVGLEAQVTLFDNTLTFNAVFSMNQKPFAV